MLVKCRNPKCNVMIDIPPLYNGMIACKKCYGAATPAPPPPPPKPELTLSEALVIGFIVKEERKAEKGEQSPIIQMTEKGIVFVRLQATLEEAVARGDIELSASAFAVIMSLAKKGYLVRVFPRKASASYRWGILPL